MFGRDLILSVVFHVVLIVITLAAGSLEFRDPPQFAEVIQVGVVSMPEISPSQAEPATEVEVPPAVQAEPEEVVLEDPATKPSVEVEEPVEQPEPEPKEEPKQPPPTEPAQTGETNQAGSGEDETQVEGPAGTSISGMTIGSADFNYPHWPSLAFSKINRFFYFSIVIDGKVHCDVKFEVIKSGRVILTEVTKSSGIPAFDQACLAAIERASPLPPLPRQWRDEFLVITLTFTNL